VFELAHTTDECPGRWQRAEAGEQVSWCCSHCGVAYQDHVAVRFAVLREYDLELAIVRLVREGRRLLSPPPEGRREAIPPEEPE
jgi:hypothetical protein